MLCHKTGVFPQRTWTDGGDAEHERGIDGEGEASAAHAQRRQPQN